MPGEEEQFLAYRDLVLGMGGLPVTIRTLDLGADKADCDRPRARRRGQSRARRARRAPVAAPAAAPDASQLRAILRASSYGPVRILVPMVATIEEMAGVRYLLDECARDLRTAGHEIAEHFELGAMIEVPAAAIALPGMIRKLDFIAIGTNDLVQYTLAVDRNNDHARASSTIRCIRPC